VILLDYESLKSLYYLGNYIFDSFGDLITDAYEKSISFKKYYFPR